MLFGPILYIFLRILKVDQNLIGFIFGIFIFFPPIIGFFMVLSQNMLKIVSIILFFMLGAMYVWSYFSDKKEKVISHKCSAIKENIKENKIDEALEIALSLPDSYALKDYTINDIARHAAQSDVSRALEITQFIKDSDTQSLIRQHLLDLMKKTGD
jgi:Ca2+/Na+ antiporter